MTDIDFLGGGSISTQTDELRNKAKDTQDAFKGLSDEIIRFREAAEKSLSAGLREAVKNGSDFTAVFTKIRSALEDVVIQLAVVNPAMNALFGGRRGDLAAISGVSSGDFKGDTGLLGNLFGSIFSLFEGRASGGPVTGGTPYIVGERGPELFVPPSAGRINPSIGGGGVNITMNISASDASSFRSSQAQIAAQMVDAVRRAQRIR